MNNKIIGSVVIMSLFVRLAIAQEVMTVDSGRLFFMEPKVLVGTIVSNNEKAQLLVKDNPYLLQLDISVLKNTKSAWNYCNCYTQTGVSLSYINFGNAQYLGKAITFSAFTEPYLVMTNKVRFSMRGAAGFAYLNKVYDAQYDSNNLFYSKPLSYILSIGASVKYKVTPSVMLSLHAQFNHISNGGSRWPNWGMNTPMIGVGMAYSFKPDILKKRERLVFDDFSWKIIVHYFGGRNTVDANRFYPETKRLVTGVNLGIIKPLGRISSVGFGGEVYYDGTASVWKERTEKEFKPGVVSVSIQHYLSLGKLLLGQQLAYYVTQINPDVHSRLYQRYFIEYKVTGPLYLGVSLKGHGNVSDYLTLSTGYIFNTHTHK